MRSTILALALGSLIASEALSAPKPVVLQMEERTTLRVGQLAVLQIPSDRRYVVQVGKTTPEGTLRVVRHLKRSVWFRAVRPGKDVFLVSPVTKSGECISCATIHYYIDVMQ